MICGTSTGGIIALGLANNVPSREKVLLFPEMLAWAGFKSIAFK